MLNKNIKWQKKQLKINKNGKKTIIELSLLIVWRKDKWKGIYHKINIKNKIKMLKILIHQEQLSPKKEEGEDQEEEE